MFRSRAAAAVLLIASLGLAGCGGGSDGNGSDLADLSAAELLDQATDELESADAVSLAGERSNGTATVGIDLDFVGDDSAGSVQIGDITATMLVVDDQPYFTFDDGFYQQVFGEAAADAQAKVDGRWIVVEPDDPNFTDLLTFVDRDEFVGSILDPEGTPRKTDGKTIDGIECLALQSDTGILYVDASSGRPVSIVPDGKPDETVTFTYDDIETPEAPAESDTVTLEEIDQS